MKIFQLKQDHDKFSRIKTLMEENNCKNSLKTCKHQIVAMTPKTPFTELNINSGICKDHRHLQHLSDLVVDGIFYFIHYIYKKCHAVSSTFTKASH